MLFTMLLAIIGSLHLWAHDFPEFIAADKSIKHGRYIDLAKSGACKKFYRVSNSLAISGVFGARLRTI
jgi:hypothetical protein